ncbi:MAG TPA: cell division protein FtsL [Terriglobales bacterium]|nr:cell division protein FtsL [Terriglobales bacterium]
MAATALTNPVNVPASRRRQEFVGGRQAWSVTPEVYFAKQIDNSRLVKVDDPKRKREMRMFSAVLCMLFALVMMYAWQHFSAIEYGYKIEDLKAKHDNMAEANRLLRLDLAQLRDPERIDAIAKQMGLQTPDAGQVQRLDAGSSTSGAPVLAKVQSSDVMVISQ